jgi:hypothetical protein
MVALHQHLELRLDLGLVGADLQAKLVQGLALGVAHDARRLGLFGLGPRAELAEHVERIARGVGAKLGAGMIAGSHLPGRAMPGDRVLLVFQHGVVAHAGEVIVGVVVLAHVLQAEPPVLILALPALGRAMGRGIVAALPVAARHVGAPLAVLRRLDANAIEQR